MRYWIHVGSSPSHLTQDEVVGLFRAGQVGWETPACIEGASEWTIIREIPSLAQAINEASAVRAQTGASHVGATRSTSNAEASELSREIASLERQRGALSDEVQRIQSELNALRAELGSVEEALEIQSLGFYQPRYGFDSSDQYAARLEAIRSKQQQLLKAKLATRCDKKWTVDGSAKKGAAMVRDQAKLMLRAFNGECDAAIAKVKYNNASSLQKRIEKALSAINALGASKHIDIAPEYAALKIDELHLVHEHREKLQEEREIQRDIRARMREEQKAAQEIEEALDKAEREEKQREEALDRARRELAVATGLQQEKFEQLVSRLENELSEALDRKAKAIARAQLTRSGHVYVLSNIGCFGENCYKIGMTRRFEPLERIQELGDASVPFQFDVHAMIYSDDAPALEKALHEEFATRRVNRVNQRKEFFRVTLDEIHLAVDKLHGKVTFVTVAEAIEFRKTRALESEADSTG